MNSSASPKRSVLETACVLARWVMGALFVYMGLSKALAPEHFLELARQYDLVTNPFLLNSIASALPWFEVFCGLLLLAGVAVRGTALMLIVMLVPFTILILKRALLIAATEGKAFCVVKFDCGCGAGEVIACHKLIENCGLIFLAGCLLIGWGRRFCLRYNLIPSAGPE